MRWITALVCAVLLLSACGGDDSASTTTTSKSETTTTTGEELDSLAGYPDCADWVEEGPASAADAEEGCRTEDTLNGTGTYDCTDGRVLYWNDAVWGYVGEPAHEYAADAEQVAPKADREACPG